MSCKPLSFHLLERESSTNFITWTYPTITESCKKFIQKICFSEGLEVGDIFYYLRHQNTWIYINQFTNNNKRGAVIFTSNSHKPNLYKALCDIFIRTYASGSPVDLVKLYLKIYIKNGVYLKEDNEESLIQLEDFPLNTNLKGLINSLGIEIILVYNALLLKKKVLVHHTNVEELQQSLDSMIRLIPAENSKELLYPLILSNSELKKIDSGLFGSNNKNILSVQHLFDLVVNLKTQRIEITQKSRESFLMSPLHKEIANVMVELARSEATESEVIDGIMKKTEEVYQVLKPFVTVEDNQRRIAVKDVESKTKNKNLQKFIVNLAVAENIRIVT